jgi:hypothetical protein
LHDGNGNPIGIRNSNPLLVTREYKVTFQDGSSASYLANTIAENTYSQVDQEGRSFTLLDEIIDHEEDPDIVESELPQHTMNGWHFLVAWKDGSTSCVPLREMKNTYPIETANYAVSNKIEVKPAFRWLVPQVLRKCTRLISKLKKGKTKYWHRPASMALSCLKAYMKP